MNEAQDTDDQEPPGLQVGGECHLVEE
jgi:hypothetical protein